MIGYANVIKTVTRSAITLLIAGGSLSPEMASGQPTTYSLVALGDSLTTAFDAEGIFENLDYSWSTGTTSDPRLVSHYKHLKQMMPTADVLQENLATSGSMAAETITQVQQMRSLHPNYVTLLSGANDLCTWIDPDLEHIQIYKHQLIETLDYLIAHSPEVKILLVPIPNLAEVYNLGIANHCEEKWSIFNVCQKLLSPSNTELDRQQFYTGLEQMNLTIYDVAQSRQQNVKFATGVDQARLTFDQISKIDCFHPSVAGQNYLAQLTWSSGWFAH